MKLLNVATLGTENKVFYDAAGNMYSVVKPLRATIKVGDTVIVNEKTFTSRTNPTTQQIEECAPWTKQVATFAGTRAAAIAAKNESALIGLEEEAYLAEQTKEVRKKFNLADAGVA